MTQAADTVTFTPLPIPPRPSSHGGGAPGTAWETILDPMRHPKTEKNPNGLKGIAVRLWVIEGDNTVAARRKASSRVQNVRDRLKRTCPNELWRFAVRQLDATHYGVWGVYEGTAAPSTPAKPRKAKTSTKKAAAKAETPTPTPQSAAVVDTGGPAEVVDISEFQSNIAEEQVAEDVWKLTDIDTGEVTYVDSQGFPATPPDAVRLAAVAPQAPVASRPIPDPDALIALAQPEEV
jgi:hypothetical protein